MKYDQRRRWILNYLQAQKDANRFVDILNAAFVDAYLQHTQAAWKPTMIGANKCPQLGRDLAKMYHEGSLRRITVGLEGMSGMGFPRWVYKYGLSEFAKVF